MKPNALLTLLGLSLAVGTFFWWRSRRPEAADESLRLSSESEEDIQLFPTIVSPLATVIDIGPTPPLSSLSTPTQRQSRTALNISRIAAMVGDNTIGMPSWNPQKHSGHWYAVSKGGGVPEDGIVIDSRHVDLPIQSRKTGTATFNGRTHNMYEYFNEPFNKWSVAYVR